MTRDDITKYLRLHALWLADNSSGKRADLTDADLTDAMQVGAN